MAMPSEPRLYTGWGPSGFNWKVIARPNHELRVEPQRMGSLAVFMALFTMIFIVIIWLTGADGDPRFKIVMSIGGLVAGVSVAASFWYVNSVEQRRGAHLILDEKGIHLRQERRVDFSDFESFELVRGWESVGDSYKKVTYLFVVCKSQEQIEIVQSIHHRAVVKLKNKLDEQMAFLAQ